tara:strand:- start:274 stop:492 length:219 start_codon:yes stop_codon:yes gene_type:complete
MTFYNLKKIIEYSNELTHSKLYSTVTPYSVEGENKPFLFFELHCSYCFNPNTYEFKEELIDWDYKGFRLGFE